MARIAIQHEFMLSDFDSNDGVSKDCSYSYVRRPFLGNFGSRSRIVLQLMTCGMTTAAVAKQNIDSWALHLHRLGNLSGLTRQGFTESCHNYASDEWEVSFVVRKIVV